MARDRARRRRRGVAAEASAHHPLVEQVWGRLMTPGAVGVGALVAGAALVAAPLARFPQSWSARWWTAPLASPDVVVLVAVVLAVALVALAGLFWERFLSGEGGADASRAPDMIVAGEIEVVAAPHPLLVRAPQVGVVCMALGAALSVGAWMTTHRQTPAMEATLPLGEQSEFFAATIDGRPARVMLPRRVEVLDITLSGERAVKLRVTRPKQTDAPEQVVRPGESLVIDGQRLTFMGVQDDPRTLRAIISGAGDASIEAAARQGEEVRVTLDGPAYKVLALTQSYPSFMGPAVQLQRTEPPDSPPFWLFLRDQQRALGHDLRLRRVQTLPAAVFTISPAQPFWPLLTSGILLALGLGLFLMVPEITRRRGEEEGTTAGWSLNEAGSIAESFPVAERVRPVHARREDEVASPQPHAAAAAVVAADTSDVSDEGADEADEADEADAVDASGEGDAVSEVSDADDDASDADAVREADAEKGGA